MKTGFLRMTALALGGLLAVGAQAQVLGNLTVTPSTVRVGEPVTVTATIDVANSNYCGFGVFFGDNTDKDGVSDSTHTGPFVFQHVYTKPGTYTINLGGRHVQSHPNCGGADKTTVVTVTGAANTQAAAASLCPAPWKLVAKSHNSKTGAFACSAKRGTAVPDAKPSCAGELTYYENSKKGQLGCRP